MILRAFLRRGSNLLVREAARETKLGFLVCGRRSCGGSLRTKWGGQELLSRRDGPFVFVVSARRLVEGGQERTLPLPFSIADLRDLGVGEVGRKESARRLLDRFRATTSRFSSASSTVGTETILCKDSSSVTTMEKSLSTASRLISTSVDASDVEPFP